MAIPKIQNKTFITTTSSLLFQSCCKICCKTLLVIFLYLLVVLLIKFDKAKRHFSKVRKTSLNIASALFTNQLIIIAKY